jgi:hypothetical protein
MPYHAHKTWTKNHTHAKCTLTLHNQTYINRTKGTHNPLLILISQKRGYVVRIISYMTKCTYNLRKRPFCLTNQYSSDCLLYTHAIWSNTANQKSTVIVQNQLERCCGHSCQTTKCIRSENEPHVSLQLASHQRKAFYDTVISFIETETS